MLHLLTSSADAVVSWIQTALFTTLIQPLLYKIDLMDYDEDTYDALYWFIVAVFEIVGMYLVLRPLEALFPAEKWQDRRAVGVDALYTWVTRLGVINVIFFFSLQPLFDAAQGALRYYGLHNVDLDAWWPGTTQKPLLTFVLYLVALDFAGYWYHRWQHRFGWWWELHAVHHSQRQMSMWSDDRNHVVDTLLESCFFALVALLIGVQPSQFVVLVAASQIAQSVQHANIRTPVGVLPTLLSRLLVSPTFHRRHHAIGFGHEGVWYGCNFGVLFPWWDMMFGTASWARSTEPTGIRDQLAAPHGVTRQYGDGFWSQQYLAIGRSAHRIGRWLSGQAAKDNRARAESHSG